jgi:hypothetical protein
MKAHNLQVTGSLTTGGEAIGSISSSVATTTLGLGSRITTIEGKSLVSGSGQIPSLLPSGVVSGSAQTISNLPSGTISGSAQVDVMSTTNIARLATTGSNTFQGSQTVNGSLVVTGSLTAQQFIVSSSVTYLTESFASGSHKFGDSSDDTHQFTGSVYISGSVGIYANTTASGSLQINTIGNNGTNALVFNGGTSYVNTYMGSFSEGLYISSNYSYVGGHRSDSSAKRSMEMYMNTDEFNINTMAAATPGTRTRLLTVSGSAGFIGVGTSTPGSVLHIKGGTAGGADFGAELRVWENTFGAVLQGFTYGTTAAFLGNFRYNINTPASSVTNYYNAGHGMLFLDGVHIYSSQPGGTSGGAFTPSERLTILNNGNMGVSVTSPASKLHVGGNIKYSGRIFSSQAIVGNIYTNLTSAAAPSYILVYDLNETSGWSLVGHCNAASWTCWNISQIYIQKNYSSTAASAGITGLYKSGCNMTIVDLSYGGGRYIAIGYTSNPEIDVVWTGYNLTNQFTSDGQATVVAGASVTVNATLATY